MYVAPLAAVIVGPGLEALLSVIGAPAEISIPLAILAALTILFNGGPALDQWRLTGEHMITPSTSVLGFLKV